MIAVLLAALALAEAEPAAALELEVRARGSREPLAGAAVTVDGAPAGETDEDGRLSLSLPAGAHVLQVQQPGYEILTRTVTLEPGTPATLVLRLDPGEAGPRYETTVRAAAPEAPAVRLEREEMTRTPGTLGDPFRVIESLPGVAPVVWPLPIYAIRGANPGNTGHFVDGMRVPALFHFALGPAVIHPYFLEALEFYPGSAPARYGRFASGIVAASTIAPPPDRPRGSIDVRVYDAGGLVSVPVGARGTAVVAGRYAFPAALFTALQDEARLEYWDYQARIDHPLGPGRLTVFALGSYDLLEPKLVSEADRSRAPRLSLAFHHLDARWRAGLGGGRLTLGLGAGLDETTAPFEDSRLAGRARTLAPRALYQRALAVGDLEVGADGELQDYDTRLGVDGPSLAGFARPREVVVAGAHVALALRIGERLRITPGLRVDSYAEGGTHAVDAGPRLHVRARASERVSVHVSGGRTSQMPSLPLQLPGFEGFGLAELGLQSAWQGALGVDVALPGQVTAEATTFVQRYVLTDVRDPELGDPLLDDFLASREALAYGLELLVRRPPTARTHGWISYTLSRALRAFEGNVVGPADWDQRHVLNLVAGHRWRRYTFGGRVHVHTGRPVKVAGTAPPDFARLPPFWQLDLRAERRFVLDTFTLDLYLELVNATLTRQVIGLRRTPEGLAEEGYRLVLPALGVRGEF